MLFINPHQPWYGSGMFTEMHVKSDQGLDFSGAMYPGGPLPTAGFNQRLGWAYTVNEADISDVYRLTFDHPTDRLLYRYGDGWRRADEWTVTLSVRDAATGQLAPRRFTLRKSHYGPVMAREDNTHWLAVRVPKLHSASRLSQALAQAKARNFAEWRAAAARLDLQTLNTTYADADGNIYYLYNGAIAKRDPSVGLDQAGRRRRSPLRVERLPHHRRAAAGPQSTRRATCRTATRPRSPPPMTAIHPRSTSPPTWPKTASTTSDARRCRASCCAARATSPSTTGRRSPTTPRSTGR